MSNRAVTSLLSALATALLAVAAPTASLAQDPAPAQTERKPDPVVQDEAPQDEEPATQPQEPDPGGKGEQAGDEPAREERRKERERRQGSDEVVVEAREQERAGDVVTYTGYVDVTYQNVRLQADRVTYNETTNVAIAEGNVIFDQGRDQRVTARRAEVNVATKLGTFYDVTGFTDRTATGELLYYTASRVDKVGPDEYLLFDAEVTACEDAVPKWSFRAAKARLVINDKVTLRNAVFEVKDRPVFYLPYGYVPIARRERQSGFLLPRFGSSNAKGLTYSQAYYQTLGRSADLMLNTDVFTERGLGVGFEFRARTDERSGIRLGSYLVKDRLWGDPGLDQGGSAFFAEGVQYLPDNWLAVADVRITSNLEFRRAFSGSFEEIINPEERSTLYVNNNTGRFSFDLLAEGDTTTIQQQDLDRRLTENFAITIRHLPSATLLAYDRPIRYGWPLYFALDAAVEGLRRRERVGDVTTYATPDFVQRLDVQPRFTLQLPSFAGWAVTPSIALRSTYYSNSINPAVPRFDPRIFTLDPTDPRLDPGKVERPLQFFDPAVLMRVVGKDLARNYLELAVDLRAPSFERVFSNDDGEPIFKHVVEPYAVYRLIAGISNFELIPRFDERDAIANTNELEYGLVNHFFVRRQPKGAAEAQPHELLSVIVRQKVFFDETFGGAFDRLRRSQFYPINTFSGFSYGGIERRASPVNVVARLRPIRNLFADLRVDYDVQRNGFKDAALAGGVQSENFSVQQVWYINRRFRALRGRVEPGTYAGNQWETSFRLGNASRGWYGGSRLKVDFTDRVDVTAPEEVSQSRLLNTRSNLGYSWDCCGLQLNYNTFNLPNGVRRESQAFITFTLAGIGSIGNGNIGQPAQTRRLDRARGGRNRLDLPQDEE